MKKARKIALFLSALMLVSPALVACGDPGVNGNDDSSSSQVVNKDLVESINLTFNEEGGSVNYTHGDYKVGDNLVLDIANNKGYQIAQVFANGKKIRPKNGVYVVNLDSKVVNISVLFEKNKVIMTDFDFEFNDVTSTAKILKYQPDRNIIPYPFVIPETVTHNNKTYVIDSLAKNAFDQSSLQEITLSKNIKNIEVEGFSHVHGLLSIDVVKENPYFASEKGVLYSKDFKTLIAVPTEYQTFDFKIKDGVTTVEKYAMQNTRLITDITIPNSVTTLKEGSFISMPSLIRVNFGNSISEIPDHCFENAVSLVRIDIPEGVARIGDHAFGFCPQLRQVSFPSTLKEIGVEAFFRAQKIEKLDLNEGLEVIHKSAFSGVLGVSEVKMPSTLIRLEDTPFETCFNLTKLVLNEGLKYLGGAIAWRAPYLEEFVIPSSVEEIHYNPCIGNGEGPLILSKENKNFKMVDGILYSADMTRLISCPYSNYGVEGVVEIPDTVTELGYNCFSLICHIKKIVIPTSVVKMDCSFDTILPNPSGHGYDCQIEYLGTSEQFNQIDHGEQIWNYNANFKGNMLICKGDDTIITLTPQGQGN